MKERTKGFLAGMLVMLLIVSLSVTAFAAYRKNATLEYADIKITLDGKRIIPKDVNGNAVDPFIIDGTTYLPVRAISSTLGLGVDWDQNTKTVILSSNSNSTTKSEYKIGETWTVNGQWSLTVNSVRATNDRNPYADYKPGAVYIIDYTYTNLGYVDQDGIMNGLFLCMDNSIVDHAGVMGQSYPGDIYLYPQEVPVGATCKAQACVGVDNPGSFKVIVSDYDGNGKQQTATFALNVG